MAKNPQNPNEQNEQATGVTAPDDERRTQEQGAAETERLKGADLTGAGASHAPKSHPKVHRIDEEDEEPEQDMPGEPLVEDEP